MAQVGFIPLIAAGISLASNLYGSKKAEKKEREAYYQANQQAIASGQAVSALSLMSATAQANLSRVWPWIREQGSFAAIDWNKLALPNGPGLSSAGAIALATVWPEVRAAAKFSDVNWSSHAVPVENVAPVMPVPELPEYMQPAKYVDSRTGQPIQAGLLPGGLFSGGDSSLMLAGGIGLALLLVLSQRR